MSPSPRSLPHQVRLLELALYSLAWERATHLAVVDACEPGWDVGAEWIGKQVKSSKQAMLDAERTNLAEGQYTHRRRVPKQMKDGRWFTATYLNVSAKWTTRNSRRNPDLHWLPLDTAFLDRNPRLGELAKRVYHTVCNEQRRYGGCALGPTRLAKRLSVERTASKSAADRVSRALATLIERGELIREAGSLFAPRYPVAPDRGRFRPDAIRASLGGSERERIAKTLHTEPRHPPLGTETPPARNHPTTRNYKELERPSGAPRREADAEERTAGSSVSPDVEPLPLKNQERALMEAAGVPTDSGTESDPCVADVPFSVREGSELPAAIEEKLASIFATNDGRRTLAHKAVSHAWRVVCSNQLGALNSAQLRVSVPRFLAQLDSVAAVAASNEHGAFGRLTTSCKWIAHADDFYDELKQLRHERDESAAAPGNITFDLEAEFAELHDNEPAAPSRL